MTDLHSRLAAMSTEELSDILRENDRDEWRPEVFPLVEVLLKDRGVDIEAVKASLRAIESQPGSAGLESVKSLGDALQANLCKMALLEAGIEAWLSTEYVAGAFPTLGLALGVDVLVRPEDAAAARELIAGLDSGAAEIEQELEACPRCASSETEHVRAPDRVGAVAGWLMVGLPLPSGAWHWKCRICGQDWQ
jgi:Putative prokaryotic signal transducing protein